ncbi:ion transporter [Aliiglaciecola sp. CAU 1673]|uniref:ion transporter n=1 Tax=Aliiglaciecola sp. CAU 1673 TaxID=3032595 RepID=UPI0023DBE4C2|nr:ion transporter [Aliiglaciecola sp. CAU 1673]MDF2180266.1 ion transporter [Aliiglaciecola sp. CAU 1673]
MLNFSLKRLRESHEGPWLFLDLLMLGLLMINLALLLFDALYDTELVRGGLNSLSPALLDWYRPINANFILIDLIFVSIFLAEFCFRWAVAVYRKTYLRWYFYPFIHWYDLVGCIPVGGARFLRLLRIISILHRLHKYQIIDLRDTAPFRFFAFYYGVLIEELSDRIVAKVLTDAQEDLRRGSPLLDEIGNKVLAARRPVLCRWLASLAQHYGHSIQDPTLGQVLRAHVQQSVGRAVRENRQVNNLRLVPVVGSSLEKMLENAVADIVIQSFTNLLTEVTPEKVDGLISYGLAATGAEEAALDQEAIAVLDECLELLKSHVSQQRWKTVLNPETD